MKGLVEDLNYNINLIFLQIKNTIDPNYNIKLIFLKIRNKG